MNDLISRQAVLELPRNITRNFFGEIVDESIDVERIESLPPAQPEQRWTPCSERLPKKHGETYIVTISDGSVYSTALQWDTNCKRWYLSFLNDDGNILVDFIDDVIAWMPLPKPWRGEANDNI